MNRKQFLQQVTSFIRSKPAQKHVEKELEQHITHAKKAWMDKGYQEEAAEALAIQHMGSPMTLGQELGKVHKPKVDWLMIGLVTLLLAFSFLPLLAVMHEEHKIVGFNSIFWRNALHIGFAIIVLVCLMLFDVQKLENKGFIFYGIAIGFLLWLHFFSGYVSAGQKVIVIGAYKLNAWYTLPFFCIAWAALFLKHTVKLWQVILLVGTGFILIASTGSTSVLLVFSVMTFVMLLQGYFERKQKIVFAISAVVAIILFVLFIAFNVLGGIIKPYQLGRVIGFLNPEKYPTTEGYIYLYVKGIIDNAKWFGAIESTFFLNGHTDFVFVQLIKSYGYVFAFIVALLLFVLIVQMGKHCIKQSQSFAKLLVIGASTLFATQVLYSLGMSIGMLPIMAVPLPFITYGFMPTLINACLVGLVLSVYRRKSYIFSS
ncbi:FtsW/RodA/SpoVE family cell cycle protein [Bacillus ndiopicus]|uniref:FtsW/RodA/SpoVE family cell cycle protein n=1 Tax=Bacillus ndiopicus TaxID=1347368 RepID=UPI0005A6FBB1|nr:FtsW/RodA/SpoVE family cell cycle protein [Bacillus ndiopicus]